MKKKLTPYEADELFEKYYEGETSVDEEKRLHAFLQQKKLPARFDSEKALFGYFDRAKSKKAKTAFLPKRQLVLRWSLAAAALIGAVLVFEHRLSADRNHLAFIDGIACTDSQRVKALALASIEELSLGSDEVSGTMESLTDVNLVESQLQLFPEIK
jgi:hypothetical protein